MHRVNIQEVVQPVTLDNRLNYQKKLAIYCILASVLFERMAFYGLQSNLLLFLKLSDLNWNSENSSNAVYIFTGVTYLSTFIFAIISDGKLGRVKTVHIGFVLYILGYVLLTVSSLGKTNLCEFNNATNHSFNSSLPDESCSSAILSGLVCAAIGAGATKANTAVLGAEQLQHYRKKWRYFEKYVLLVNLGSVIAVIAVIIFHISGVKHFYWYVYACVALLLAAIFFSIGARYSQRAAPYDSILYYCCPVVIQACRTRYQYRQDEQQDLSNLNENIDPMRTAERTLSFFDYAKLANQAKYHDRILNDMRALRSAIVVFTLLIPLWLISNQTATALRLQRKQMLNDGERIEARLLGLIDAAVIVIGIVLLNILSCKYFDRYDTKTKITVKIGLGMFFAFISMLVAGGVELARQSRSYCTSSSEESQLSVYYQIPVYVFIGLAELCCLVAYYEYAYFSAPRSGLSLFMSLAFCSIGVASFLGLGYIDLFSLPNYSFDFSCKLISEIGDRFYIYYFVLAGIQLLTLLIFITCLRKFQIIRLIPERLEENRFSIAFFRRNDTTTSVLDQE